MAEPPRIAVTLPGDAPILVDLVRLASELDGRGETLRVVGGVAMTVWGIALNRPRGVTTDDIDAAVPAEAARSEGRLKAFAAALHAAARALAYAPAPKNRPADRFAFLTASDATVGRRKLEVLVEETPLGRLSKRPPPMRHLVEGEPEVALTAAVNPWLSLMPEPWTVVSAVCDTRRGTFEVPGCPGLFALKLRAVRDKQNRIEEERDTARRAHEIGRLARHLDDLALTRIWIDLSGERDALRSLAEAHPVVRAEARDAERWFLAADPSVVRETLERGLRVRSLDGVRGALAF